MAASKNTTKSDELAASKEAVLSAYEKLTEAKEHFKSAAEAAGVDVKDEAIEQLLKGRAKAEELGKQTSEFVREKPLASLGIAFVTGLVLSHFFSRK
ncbi:hypothetical protein ACU6U9_18985 [Pseudomonas sp. HK3]|jgi:ElaB/YqjD/DUF883 family membrane-anchored ribosome-binding protein